MTDQYLSTNINSPRNPFRSIDVDADLNLDDFFVLAESGSGPITLSLPDARQIPNWNACIKAPNGAVGAVTIQPINGQTIDGLSIFQLNVNGESVFIFSDGENWQTGPTGGISGASPISPIVTNTFDNVTTDIPIGDASVLVSLSVEVSIRIPSLNDAAAYRGTVSSNETPTIFTDILIVPESLNTVSVSLVLVGTIITLRITGSGAGASTRVTHQILTSFAK